MSSVEVPHSNYPFAPVKLRHVFRTFPHLKECRNPVFIPWFQIHITNQEPSSVPFQSPHTLSMLFEFLRSFEQFCEAPATLDKHCASFICFPLFDTKLSVHRKRNFEIWLWKRFQFKNRQFMPEKFLKHTLKIISIHTRRTVSQVFFFTVIQYSNHVKGPSKAILSLQLCFRIPIKIWWTVWFRK